MSDAFTWWRKALAGEPVEINEGDPQNGFYKMRKGRGGEWLPVAIFLNKDGRQIARVANEVKEPLDVWTWCAGNPVSNADAKHALETGSWPGDAPTIGSNSGDVGPLELLKDYIETCQSWFASVGKIDTQKKADQAANYATELARLKGEADKERATKVRPHLDAQNSINGEYNPPIKDADALVKQVKRASDAFLIAEKNRKEAEARAKYEAERAAAEAERKRIETEREKQMREDPIAALTSPEPELPFAPPPPTPVKVQAGGQRGRKMGLRKFTVYDIEDYPAVVAWAAERAEVVEFIEKIARQAMKAGEAVPGMATRIEERAA